MRKWESEKQKRWGMPAEGFKGHVAADGYLLGNAGKLGAHGWAVVQLDCGGELWPLHGMYSTMEAEYEGSAHHQEAGVDSFLVPPQESM